jgi:hypothetical protein
VGRKQLPIVRQVRLDPDIPQHVRPRLQDALCVCEYINPKLNPNEYINPKLNPKLNPERRPRLQDVCVCLNVYVGNVKL